MNQQSLAGKKILITRAREQSGDFANQLKKMGAEVIEFPTIEIVPPATWKGLDRAIDQLNSYGWIIFTSTNGVNFFFERLRERRKDDHLPSSSKVCAIGPATAYQLKERGIQVDYIPKEFVAESILKGFGEMAIKGSRMLLVRAKEARDVLPKGLRKMGAGVDVVVAYQTVKPKGGLRRLKKLLGDGEIDVITFTSSSTVNYFAELLKREDMKKLSEHFVVACIGPITARTATRWGMKVRIQPREYTIPALTQAIGKYFSKMSYLSHNHPQ
jgi:uroporphyrinogen III methyltransferase/synthase